MSLVKRVLGIFKAKANTAVEKAEKADPIGIMKAEFRQSQEDLGKYEHAIKQFTAQKILLKKQYDEKRSTQEDWLEKARIAKEQDKMGLAQKACDRSVTFGEEADALEAQLKSTEAKYIQKKDQFDRKTEDIKTIGQKIKSAEVSFNVAKASNDIDASMTANGGTGSIDKINDMLNVVEQEVAMSEASDDINDSASDKLDREFDDMTSGKKSSDLMASL